MLLHPEEVWSEKAGDACEDTQGERVTDGRAAAVAVCQRSYTRRQVLVIFGVLLLGLLLAALDQTIVATALPTIAGELGGLEHLSWVVTAYLLTSTVSAPLYGKLGDLYGRKPLFQIATVIFLVGSALSGLSQGMLELILFRAVQGLGAGGLIVGAQGIVGDVVSPRGILRANPLLPLGVLQNPAVRGTCGDRNGGRASPANCACPSCCRLPRLGSLVGWGCVFNPDDLFRRHPISVELSRDNRPWNCWHGVTRSLRLRRATRRRAGVTALAFRQPGVCGRQRDQLRRRLCTVWGCDIPTVVLAGSGRR